ncbi:MAG TPA: hypothetical protein VE567_06595, partial [Sphingomonas sp.]|nr:hypothetical protein [Sphingomonas sp.]
MASTLACALTTCASEPFPPVPKGYPQAYFQTVEKAEDEGALMIWSATDRQKVAPLLEAFHRFYPEVPVTYVELSAGELNDRFVKAADAGARVPDLLWSAAMDLQIKLV